MMFFLLHILWHHPPRLIADIATLVAIGLVAGATTSALACRRGARAKAGIRLPVALLLFSLSDWLLVWALPYLQLSFSQNILLSLIASLVVRQLLFWGTMPAALLARWRGRRQNTETWSRPILLLFLATNLTFSVVQVDAYVVEPLIVETTTFTLASEKLDPAVPPVRVVHLTDLHIARLSYRERTVIQKVSALQPDIVVITGDYINTTYFGDATAHRHLREFLAQIEAPYGIYVTRGTVEPSTDYMANLMAGTDVVWLEQEAVTVNVRGQRVTLVGVNCDHDAADVKRLEQAMTGVPEEAFTLLLYHSPDLIYEAAGYGIDLYLGGHIHGGQLRLPFYGAIVSASLYGKQYEAGRYEVEGTAMYISRGIGFEGGGMPRARFLCPPEIVSIDLVGR